MRVMVYDLIQEFEDKHNRPPYAVEISEIYKREKAKYITNFTQLSLIYMLNKDVYIIF